VKQPYVVNQIVFQKVFVSTWNGAHGGQKLIDDGFRRSLEKSDINKFQDLDFFD
jgi:hypothetical protein